MDDAYRFHQFWGGMALALPALIVGAILHGRSDAQVPEMVAVTTLGLAFEAGAIWGAIATFRRYLARVRKVLNG